MTLNSEHLSLDPVPHVDEAVFRAMVLAYLQELMPKAEMLEDEARREQYFREEFDLDNPNVRCWWARIDNRRVGFIQVTIYPDSKHAYIEDFYVIPEVRRLGWGTAMVNWLFRYLDGQGIEQIDLSVRRDNSNALAFWQAQEFGIADYRLRQYRNPETGTAFEGPLSSDF